MSEGAEPRSAVTVSPGRRRAYAIALSLASVAIVATRTASWFIGHAFPDRPLPPDVLLGVLPFLPFADYVADVAVLAAMASLLAYWLRHDREAVPGALTVFAITYLLRSVFIVLTPLANPHGPEYYGIMGSQNGMWPSGHSANVLLCFLLVDVTRAPGLRRAVLVFAVTEWVFLLLSRGHFSIDIVGGILLAYFVWAEWTRGSLFAPLRRLVEP